MEALERAMGCVQFILPLSKKTVPDLTVHRKTGKFQQPQCHGIRPRAENNAMMSLQQRIPNTQNLHKSVNTWHPGFTLIQPNVQNFHAGSYTKVFDIWHFYTLQNLADSACSKHRSLEICTFQQSTLLSLHEPAHCFQTCHWTHSLQLFRPYLE